MIEKHGRTVWFPKDFLLGLIVMIPLWGIGGLVWGLWMAFFTGGPLLLALLFGLLWGASVWLITAILMAIFCREVSGSVPLQDAATLPESLAGAAKRCRYSVEQVSPTSFVCQPKRILSRFMSFEYTKLLVEWRDGRVVLTGPSGIVNKVGKKLLMN